MWCCFRTCPKRKYKYYITAVLIAIAVYLYSSHFKNNSYVHISKRSIHSVLYKKVIPSALKKDRPNCPYVNVLFNRQTMQPMDVLKKFSFDADGIENGSYSPPKCNPLFSVALVVTSSNRGENLDVFLTYMHDFLRRQNIHYKIYVVEQQDSWPVNRGLLNNVGARAAAAARFPCLLLHRADLLPLDAANLHACATQPRHLSAAIDKHGFTLLHETYIGGVLAIRTDQYVQLNGFTNRFWGWGAEDDDFYMRLYAQRIKFIRFPPSMSRYTMLPPARPLPPARRRELRTARAQDGLRSAPARARVRSVDLRLYTLLTVHTYGPIVTPLNRSNVF